MKINTSEATHVIFNGDTFCYIKKSGWNWFIDLGDGWQNVREWKLINVYWFFGWRINIYGKSYKLNEIK